MKSEVSSQKSVVRKQRCEPPVVDCRLWIVDRGLPRLVIYAVVLALLVTHLTTAFAQPDRSAPPKLGPPPALKLPPIQHLKLSNGIPVVLLEKHAVPVVQINLVVRGGAVMDPPDRHGVASMTAAMLMEGAGPRNALQLADAIDYLGARIGTGAGQHTSGINLHTPLAKLDSALTLLSDVARRPSFPLPELDRKRKERLTALTQWRDEPRALASVLFSRTLYGSSHPYGVPTMGNEASLRSMTPGDLKKFHSDYFVPSNVTVIVVGDVSGTMIMPKLEKAFGSWKGKAAAPPSIPSVGQIKEKTLLLVDKPGAAQSVIMIGRVGVKRITDDYFPIVVMNTILGGSFTSRLNQNLREQHGYSYGAGSRFEFRPLPGPFVASASVQTAVTDKALVEFMNELKGMLEEVPDTDLDRAKNYVALGFPGDFQSVGQIAGQLEELVVYNLPDDYFNKYIGRVLAVTKEDVLKAAKKYITPDNLAFIIVGDRSEVETGVTALELAPPTFLTVDEVLGPAPAVEGGQ
ncbi:MAG: pitrilysin family protein [Bacteroidota bacterium]